MYEMCLTNHVSYATIVQSDLFESLKLGHLHILLIIRSELLFCDTYCISLMAVFTLKRFGQNNYIGMLMAVGDPNWETETKVLRFVEKNDCSTVFTITKSGLEELLWS